MYPQRPRAASVNVSIDTSEVSGLGGSLLAFYSRLPWDVIRKYGLSGEMTMPTCL